MSDSYTREYEEQMREFRNDQIREAYRRGQSTAWIAEEHRLTDSQIRRIIGDTMRNRDASAHLAVYEKRERTYLIQEEGGGYVKIGTTTNNPKLRMGKLQGSNPRTLILRRVIQGDVEVALHERFKHLRVRGEWFQSAAELEAFMSSDEEIIL